MAAKSFLVLVYPKGQEPYVVRPPQRGEVYYSRKDAQREADAHARNGGLIVRAEVVDVVMTVNPPEKI